MTTLRRCPYCGSDWHDDGHNLRGLAWLSGLPRGIEPSNGDIFIHDGMHGRDRFLLLEMKQPGEAILKGQAILLKAVSHLPRWDVSIVSGTTGETYIQRVTSGTIEAARPTTTDAIRDATFRWIDGGPWLVQSSVPIARPRLRDASEDELDRIADGLRWPAA